MTNGKAKLLEYNEDDELDIDIPTSAIPARGHFIGDKSFENMKSFDLGKDFKLYFVEGEVEKKYEGVYLASLDEAHSDNDKKLALDS